MKHILYILFVAIAFAACSTDNHLETEKMPMEISVDVASFAGKTQDVSTRASVNNGIYTTFAEGDDLGVFVVDKSGKIVANNLRYVVAKPAMPILWMAPAMLSLLRYITTLNTSILPMHPTMHNTRNASRWMI